MTTIDVESLPRVVLERAVRLDNALKRIYLLVAECREPVSASDVAEKIGYHRAYVSMRLNQLVTMECLTAKKQGRVKLFKMPRERKH